MKKLLFLCLLLASQLSFGQNAENTSANLPPVEMADGFRADGKIYIVVAVVMIVLLGIFTYLFMLEKKLAKIERELNKNSTQGK